jgi:hypothetical protein
MDLEAYMYADFIMTSGGGMRDLETSLSQWERVSREYLLQMNVEKIVTLKLSTNVGRNMVVKRNGKEVREVD